MVSGGLVMNWWAREGWETTAALARGVEAPERVASSREMEGERCWWWWLWLDDDGAAMSPGATVGFLFC